MLKTAMRLIFLFTFLFLSACTSITPAPTSTLERSTPTIIMPATPQETVHPKDTGEDCPPPSKTVDIAPQYYGRAAGNSPVWAIINKPELVWSMDEITESPLREQGYQYKV